MSTQRQISAARSSDEQLQVLEDTGKALGQYRQALMDAAFNVNARGASFKAMSDFFSNPDEPGAGDGPEARAYQSVHRLQVLIGKANRFSKPFWEIYAGPLELIRDYMLNEACCELQKRWDNNFLVEIQGVSEYKLNELIFGPQGKLWNFLDKDAAPFVSRAYGKGYVPTQVQGKSMPLTPEFVSFISRGRESVQTREDSYPVVICSGGSVGLLPSAHRKHFFRSCLSRIKSRLSVCRLRHCSFRHSCHRDALLCLPVQTNFCHACEQGNASVCETLRELNRRFTQISRISQMIFIFYLCDLICCIKNKMVLL